MAAVATESALAKDIPEPAHDEVIEEIVETEEDEPLSDPRLK